jgi:hypothetical protein
VTEQASARPKRRAANRIMGPSDRGRLSGSLRSAASLTGILAPGPFAALFARVSAGPPGDLRAGAPFFVCGAILLLALPVLQVVVRRPAAAAAGAAEAR